MKKSYEVSAADRVAFRNAVGFCVGTGRMGLALQKEYQEQLALAQKEIGFSFIRGHGLFSDDMAIYQEYTDADGKTHAEYNFTYLDLVMDSYLSLNIRPFLELGFMPQKMASGEQTIFYWKGNTTPPKSYNAWCDMVCATLSHLCARYGADEVVTWPIEVWNEPNLSGFWENADMEAYFKLFAKTFAAIKKLDKRFRVGGPAICGVDDVRWMEEFMKFCEKEGIPVDFITRHHYASELPQNEGHYGYINLLDMEYSLAGLAKTREIVDSYPRYQGLDIHITEFNTSYIPNAPIHDTNQNAAFIAWMLSRLGDVNASYSYWTFGDIFEENGVPFTPFHGGFGMIANGCIPKPTFWSFAFFKALGEGACIHRSDDSIILLAADGTLRGVAWNAKLHRDDEVLELAFTLPCQAKEQAVLLTKTVDEETCNPLKLWHDLGEPKDLSKAQKKLLQEAARPLVQSQRLEVLEGKVSLSIPLKEFGVTYFEVRPVTCGGDLGYDYERVMDRK